MAEIGQALINEVVEGIPNTLNNDRNVVQNNDRQNVIDLVDHGQALENVAVEQNNERQNVVVDLVDQGQALENMAIVDQGQALENMAVEAGEGLPEPVGIPDEEDSDDQDEPKKKTPKKKPNFKLRCTGAEISDDDQPTVYNFELTMDKNKMFPGRDTITYEVDVEQNDFQNAYAKWSRKVKVGLIYCPGPPSAFVEQIKLAILQYEDQDPDEEEGAGGAGAREYKPRLRLKKETVLKIEENAFFISGGSDVYLFTPDNKNGSYIKKLNEREVGQLPVKLVYEGKEKSYDTNPKEALQKFFELIRNYNSLQRPQHQTSFVNSCLSNMKAELYPVVQDHRVSVDYSSTTGSGKSATLLINDKIYRGKESKGLVAGCTEAGLRRSVASGTVARIDEIDKKDADNVTKMMHVLWQPDGGIIQMGSKDIKVNTTVLVCTNLTPEEMMKKWNISHPDLTKYSFNWMGETPMELVNEEFQEILDFCLELGLELNRYKPFLMSLGFKVLKDRVKGKEIAKFDGLVGNRSQRFAQGLVYLENFSKELVDLAELLGIPMEEVPKSLFPSPVQFTCILKAKELVSRQAERKPSDLISEIILQPEEARKILVLVSKGRKGVGIITSRLKESSTYKSWMTPILYKMEELDSFQSGQRIRGRRINADVLEDLYPVVSDLLTITAEKILDCAAEEDQRMKKRALDRLQDDVKNLYAPDEMVTLDFVGSPSQSDGEGDDERESGTEGADLDTEDDEEDGDVAPKNGIQKADIIKFEGGVYKCTVCKPDKKKTITWKRKLWADRHAQKEHKTSS